MNYLDTSSFVKFYGREDFEKGFAKVRQKDLKCSITWFRVMAEGGKERFIKVYSNLPINVRKEIIIVIDNKPITWDVAYNEVMNNTKLGSVIIERLIKLDIL